jgi:hypothetical protein
MLTAFLPALAGRHHPLPRILLKPSPPNKLMLANGSNRLAVKRMNESRDNKVNMNRTCKNSNMNPMTLKRIGAFQAVLAAGMVVCNTGLADTIAVAPLSYANYTAGNEVNEPLNGGAQGATVQYVVAASDLTGLNNQALTGLAFRLSDNYAPSLPQINYSDYTIQLSAFSGSSLSSTFANNLVNPTTVLTGPLSLAAGAFPTGASGTTPNGFGDFITFGNAYTYNGGNLLVTISHSAPQDAGGGFLDFFSCDADWNPGTVLSVLASEANATTGTTYNGVMPVTEFTTVAVIPEPSTLALSVMGGLGGLLVFRRRK